jgi:hypothetical protein
MTTTIRRFAVALLCVTAVSAATAQEAAQPAAAPAAQPTSTLFEEAKISINERAREAGYLRVRVQPENGEAREATIAVEKRMSENDIAKGIAEALGAVIGADYEVDRDAGEHVKIRKAKRDVADFTVEIAFSAPGFAIILEN